MSIMELWAKPFERYFVGVFVGIYEGPITTQCCQRILCFLTEYIDNKYYTGMHKRKSSEMARSKLILIVAVCRPIFVHGASQIIFLWSVFFFFFFFFFHSKSFYLFILQSVTTPNKNQDISFIPEVGYLLTRSILITLCSSVDGDVWARQWLYISCQHYSFVFVALLPQLHATSSCLLVYTRSLFQ